MNLRVHIAYYRDELLMPLLCLYEYWYLKNRAFVVRID